MHKTPSLARPLFPCFIVLYSDGKMKWYMCWVETTFDTTFFLAIFTLNFFSYPRSLSHVFILSIFILFRLYNLKSKNMFGLYNSKHTYIQCCEIWWICALMRFGECCDDVNLWTCMCCVDRYTMMVVRGSSLH